MSAYCPVYAPDLFVKDIGNVPASLIYRVIEELGFGRVRRIEIRGNNAVVYMDCWDMPNTRATRILLQEAEKPLLLYYTENRCLKVVAYKTREQRDHELCEAHDKRRRIQELQVQERLEKERLEKEQIELLAKELESIKLQEFQDENISEYIPEDLVRSLDYGNATEHYLATRARIRQRIGLA
jgi:hypothetical protein